jgi:hypothetical protein
MEKGKRMESIMAACLFLKKFKQKTCFMHTKNFSALFPALFCVFLCHGQNAAPTVSITAPVKGAIFQQGQAITLTATANDTDGSIDKVEFFENGVKVAEVTDAPFAYELGFTPPGTYDYTAKAYDNKGSSAVSAAVKVIVNAPPFAFLTSPANNSIFQSNGNLILLARVGDTDDAISKVVFLQNGEKIGEDSSTPYSLSVSNLQPGPYFFAVQAFDTRGGSSVSIPVAVLVNAVPVLVISGPANGSTFPINATINFTVNATDPDGTVKKVDFFINNAKVGTDSIAPYQYEYTSSFFGNYSFIARATDDLGGIATSSTLNFVVNAAPFVAFSSPTSGAKFTPGSVLTLQANANDVDGSISKVEFWQNGVKLGEDINAPYTFIVNNLNSGGYIFAAKAFDNFGASSTSQPVAVIVNAPPTLSFTSPTKDTTLKQSTPLKVTLDAADPDGEIINITLYMDDVKVGEGVQTPFGFTLNNLALGVHKLKAMAIDDIGDTKETKTITITVTKTTSLREIQYQEIKLFPNPVRERLYLQGLQEPIRIRIYDSVGRMVRETNTRSEVSVEGLAVGRYWLITQNGDRASFVKQ